MPPKRVFFLFPRSVRDQNKSNISGQFSSRTLIVSCSLYKCNEAQSEEIKLQEKRSRNDDTLIKKRRKRTVVTDDDDVNDRRGVILSPANLQFCSQPRNNRREEQEKETPKSFSNSSNNNHNRVFVCL